MRQQSIGTGRKGIKMLHKISVLTYGCSANRADSEIMCGLLKKSGYDIVNNPKESDLNIINTCVVKQPTQSRMIFRIKELTKLNKPLIVAGCMPKIERDVVEKIAPKASMLGPDSVQKIIKVVNDTLSGKKVILLKDLRKPKLCLPRARRNNIIHITPIAIGCTSACSYCCVRFARGKIFSYPPDLIIKDIEQALKQGCKEIWLTSQDNGCYGLDIGVRLPELLRGISEIPGKFFVRVGMMNPAHVKGIVDELIDAYKSNKIFKFLHLPVQSGSDRILGLMNRDYTVKEFKEIVKGFRKQFPFLTLSTDIIVGFPGETGKDFQRTINLIKKFKPDIVNVSKFGKRPMTKAAEMKQLPNYTIKERAGRLVKMVKEIQLENNKKWLDWEGEVLLDEEGKKGGVIGRNFAYKPIVTKGKIGTFMRVKITEIHQTFLLAK